MQKPFGESQLYPAFPCFTLTHSSCVPNQEKPNFALSSWMAYGSGELQVYFQKEQFTQNQLRKSLFLSTESLPTGDLPHPWVEQSVFSAPAFPAVYPRFVSSVSPGEHFQKAGRCSTEVPGCCSRVCSTTCCPRSRRCRGGKQVLKSLGVLPSPYVFFWLCSSRGRNKFAA